jgi:hypothetical protein
LTREPKKDGGGFHPIFASRRKFPSAIRCRDSSRILFTAM